MELILNLLPKLASFISWLTPRRMLLITAFFLTLIVSLTLFEQRNLIFSKIGDGAVVIETPPKIRIAESVADDIITFVDGNKKVVFFSLVSSSIRLNQSEIVYFYTDNPVLRELHLASLKDSGSSFPIFTSIQGENAQMVSALNGEFACYKYEETFKNRSLPQGASIAPYVCNISLPPYYGEFSGFITFGLIDAPTAAEIDALRLVGTRISTEIYTRNFKRKLAQ